MKNKLQLSERERDGEAWVWCTDCQCKLYSIDSFDGDEMVKCPTKKECDNSKQHVKTTTLWEMM
jgi:uncharacterized C2H2 Zn-finger protein